MTEEYKKYGVLLPDEEHPLVGPNFLAAIHEWQLCPKCEGTGLVWNTNWPYSETIITTTPVDCDLCNGKKIISKVNGLPPV